jgi:uncharacterized protein (TIGR02271 family)
MNATTQQWNFREGTEVFGSDGDKVGKIVATTNRYFVVEKGFFFPNDYYIPMSAISTYDDDKIYLNVTKDEALNQGWDTQPLDVETDNAVESTSGYAADTGTMRTGTTTASTTAATTDQETLRVPVHEEEMTATTRPVDRGSVNVSKDVVTEEQTLNVPVTEERVQVERRAVDREVTPDDTAFQEGTISVPVKGEEVDLQKRTRVTEEVDIGKQATQQTKQVGGTVRKEQVRVEDNSDATVTDATSGAGTVPPPSDYAEGESRGNA